MPTYSKQLQLGATLLNCTSAGVWWVTVLVSEGLVNTELEGTGKETVVTDWRDWGKAQEPQSSRLQGRNLNPWLPEHEADMPTAMFRVSQYRLQKDAFRKLLMWLALVAFTQSTVSRVCQLC